MRREVGLLWYMLTGVEQFSGQSIRAVRLVNLRAICRI
jgi:hypothetical protein